MLTTRLLVSLLLWFASSAKRKPSADEATIKKSQGAMCRAIISEMFIEIRKHDLRKDGEDDIYETVPAICLGVVQNYTYTDGVLEFRGPLDESPGAPMPDISAMMLVKKACERFTEKYVDEISGVVYKKVYESESGDTAEDFCGKIEKEEKAALEKEKIRKLKAKEERKAGGKKKAKKKKAKMDQPLAQPGTAEGFQEFLNSHDKDGSISALLAMEKDSPEKMLADEDQASIVEGVPDVKCSVCRAAVAQVLKRAKAKGGKALQDEGELTDIVSDICVGQPSCEDVQRRLLDRGSSQRVADVGIDCVHDGVYPRIPGNPPAWAAYYKVSKTKAGRWKLGRAKKNKRGKYPKMGQRGRSEQQHIDEVVRNTMVSRACREVFHDGGDHGEGGDLAELIVTHASASGSSSASDTATVAGRFCDECSSKGSKGSKAQQEEGKEETVGGQKSEL